LRDAFSEESDPAKQKVIATKLQARAYEVVPYVNYGQWFQPVAYRSSLKGVLISPVPFFWNIELN
jgi:peptide/nickel transport system substrate-binding protein